MTPKQQQRADEVGEVYNRFLDMVSTGSVPADATAAATLTLAYFTLRGQDQFRAEFTTE